MPAFKPSNKIMAKPSDRRQAVRYEVSLDVLIRFLPDGQPIRGSGVEIGPNGMRLLTPIPLAEAAYVHVAFETASNNTHCEGRVVWTQRSQDKKRYESGIDIQRWGGGIPGHEVVTELPNIYPKKDRRKKPR
jgi:hypothetical protein